MVPEASDQAVACAAICGLFARVFRLGLEPGLLARCAADGLAGAWPVAPRTQAGCDALALFAKGLACLDESAVEADNTRLFLGPENPVPVWESVWTTEDALLFAPCEAEVRALYAGAGFAPPCANEPADHLAYEFAFLATQLSRGETKSARAFLTDHLGRWGGACLAEISRCAETDLYRGAARLAADFLADEGIGPG
jgi:TorA maturation chaperone TorD